MTFSICAYFDVELEKFYPFVAPQTKEQLIEALREGAIKGKIEDCEHKKAYLLGEFETTDGKITLIEKPELLVDLTAYGKREA